MEWGREGGIPIEKVPHLAVLDDALEEAGNVVYLCEFLHVVTESRCEEMRGPWLTDTARPLTIYWAEFLQLACLSPAQCCSTAASAPALQI